jgi:hypothetical protein
MLYDKWVTEVFPTMQTAAQNWWTIVSTIFGELGRWINKNIMPWVELLAQMWLEKQLAMAENIKAMWTVIEPIWTAIKNWLAVELQKTLESFGAKWALIMAGLEAPVRAAKGIWDGFVSAVTGFWDWISSKTFSFNISIPDLPDWAVPGSPLPIHTAWSNFADDMSGMDIAPSFSLPNMAYDTASAMPMSGRSGGGSSYTANTTVNVASGDDPLRALRASRLLDKIGL